uniref:V-SNARE coiled-coil homology domain-containing protein n=1 Tax=Chenopodium quinoa TaxID=63459 RepID=A0A803N226_CHEQI
MLPAIASGHEMLECLELGPDFCDRNSSDAIRAVAICCPRLRRLRCCALNCTNVEEDANFVTSSHGSKGKLLLSLLSDIFKEVGSLFVDDSMKGWNVFLDWRDTESKDQKLDDIMNWLKWVLLFSLLRIDECNPPGLDNFWVSHGATLLLSLMQSSQEDIQEREATGLATSVVIDDEKLALMDKEQKQLCRVGVCNFTVLCFKDYFIAIRKMVLDEYQKAFGDSWKGVTSDSTQPWPYLNDALAKYQDPAEADKLLKIQRELDETKIILHKTIDSVLERGERLDSLVEKSSDLSAASQMFYKQAKKTNSCCTIL